MHQGFYTAAQSVKDEVLRETDALLTKFRGYSLIVSGHSLGGALATLMAVEISLAKQVESGSNFLLINYGSPRVGNDAMSAYVSNNVLVDRIIRVTHYKDTVPHQPSTFFGFQHVSGEWYEDENHVLHSCTGAEDRTCADQWNVGDVSDHMFYLNQRMFCIFPSNSS